MNNVKKAEHIKALEVQLHFFKNWYKKMVQEDRTANFRGLWVFDQIMRFEKLLKEQNEPVMPSVIPQACDATKA